MIVLESVLFLNKLTDLKESRLHFRTLHLPPEGIIKNFACAHEYGNSQHLNHKCPQLEKARRCELESVNRGVRNNN